MTDVRSGSTASRRRRRSPVCYPSGEMGRLLGCLTLAVCCCAGQQHYAEFVRTRRFTAPPRPGSAVRIFTRNPSSEAFLEVGLVNSTASSFEDAVVLARWEAGSRGCDALVITGQGVARSRWGAIVDESNNVSGVCLLRLPSSRSPRHGRRAPAAAPTACRPPCRQGFDCTDAGACASACNPPCAPDRECMGHGAEALCVPLSVLSPPPSPPSAPSAEQPAEPAP